MYHCKRCRYKTEKKSNYERHLKSKKHTERKNICNLCDFSCLYDSEFNRHLLTEKHLYNLKRKNQTKFVMESYKCEYCEREFKSFKGQRQHMKHCIKTISSSESFIEMKDELKETLKTVTEINKTIDNKITPQNIVINNTFNTFNILNYLNQECSDALNLNDFIKELELSSSELEQFGLLGYVEGLKGVIVDKLDKLETKKRPLHCTDTKRLTFYLKNDNMWKKSTNYDFLDKPIDLLYTKQVNCLQKWKCENPDYLTNKKKSDTFTDIMVGITEIDKDENRSKYKKKIAKILGNSVKFSKL